MRIHHLVASLLVLAPTAVGGGSNPSNVFLNEVFASHTGTDDFEMIELVGTPSASLSGYVVCVVEGEGAGAGTLDRAWDLSALSMPADGYFVLGNTAEPNKDLDIGATNTIENGTETVYVVHSATPALITALLGTSIDAGGQNTTLGTLGTIVDSVGMIDGGWVNSGEVIFDDATVVGPDGSNLPAGIYRNGDYPGKWCTDFLDFDDVANTDRPRTPGSANGTCAVRTYGSPQCTSASGHMTLAVTGDTTAGTGSVTLEISNGPTNGGAGGALSVLFIGAGETSALISGGCQFLVLSPLNFFPPLDAAGDRSIGPAAIPSGATGAVVYMQVVSFEAGNFVESNAIELEIL